MIAKSIQRLISKLIAVVMLFSIVTPLALLAHADSSGQVTVSTNLADGNYTIQKLDGTIVGIGQGTNPTQHVLEASAAPGTGYKIVFGAVAGFRSPDPSPVYFNLLQGAMLTYGPLENSPFRTGIYTNENLPASGAVNVSTNLADGAYTIYSATDVANATPMGTGNGVNATQFTLPASATPGTGYKIVFNAVAGFTSPSDFYFNLIESALMTFGPAESGANRTGDYTAIGQQNPTGTIHLSTNIAAGAYNIYSATDVSNATSMGIGGGLVPVQHVLAASAIPGTGYKIVFDAVAGFVTPQTFFFNLVSNQDVTFGPNEAPAYRTGLYTPIGQGPQETVNVNTNNALGAYRIYPGASATPVANGSGTAFQSFNLDASATPGTAYRIVFDAVAPLITPADINFSLIANDPLNPRSFTGVYRANPATGSIVVNVVNQNNQTITDGNWELKYCSDLTAQSCSTMVGSGGAGTVFPDLGAGIYRVFANPAAGYQSVLVLSQNPHTLATGETHTFLIQYSTIAQFADPTITSKTASNVTPAAGSTLTYTVDYGNLGSLASTNVLMVDDYDETRITVSALSNPACTNTGTEIQCAFASIAGNASLSLTYQATVGAAVPNGTVINNIASILSADSNADVSNDSASRAVTVTPVAPTGTINVTQVGGTGTVTLVGPSPATINTASYTNTTATPGNYTATVTVPAGLILMDVRDASNTVLTAPYTQALAANGTISYIVNYAPVTTSGTVTVSQIGGLGTVTLIGPSPANVTTAVYTNAQAGTGSYSISAIAAPVGFNLVDVRDQNNNVLAAPYTQALATGGAITYNVNYIPAAATATLSITTTGALGSVTVNGTLLGTYDGTNALTTTVSVGAVNTISFGSVATFTTPADIVIAANTLVANSTTNYVGNYIPTANAATVTVTTIGALGAVSLNGNLLGTYNGVTPISAIIDVTLANTLSFGAVAGFTTPANIVIPANTLAPASTTPYVGTYVAIGSNTTINVTQVGGTGTVTLTGPSPATINTTSYTDVSATAGSYTIAITAPAGTVLVDVRDASNNVLAAPYTQALAANGTISYTVNYAPVTTTGIVTVNQAGATGTVTLLGPTPANVTTATYTNAQSGTGSYTLGAIAAPAGFNLVDVRDQNNNVLAAPYTQALTTGGAITYNVNYAAIPATGAITVTQVGATGTVNLFGPSPATIVASPYSNASAVTGNYTLSLTAPAGFILADVRNAANAVILPPYAQTLAANGTISYTVNYAPVGNSGTVRVNQIGGTGALDLIGPSPAYVTTTPYSNAQAGTGSYTLLGITAPVGTALVDVRDGNNNVLVAPYAQTLTTGGVITYNVNYSPATAFTLIKSANVASVSDNGIVTYTITLVRNTNVAGSISATLSDTVTGTGVITGANGGSALYIPNSGTCAGVTCSGQQIALAPITVTLDNPGSTATLTYQMRAFNASVVGASSTATNTVTATIAGFPTQTATSPVSLVANAAPVGPTNGSTGTTSSSGGSGGYKLKKGDMKLDFQKLVSLDGVNFVTPDAGRSLALAVPENKATRLYTKLLMNVQGDVSATNIKLRHFFDTGRSDMTADDLENLVGAHVDNRGLLTVDKVKVGETATLTYSVLVHENGRNINPAVDGLELVSFGSNLPPMQDRLTYLGLGSQVKTYLYAGSVPANADQTQGEVVPGNGSATDLGAYLALDVRANKPVANIGDTVTFTIALRNLTDGDMTNVFIDHTFDTDAFEMADAYGAHTDANGIHWKQPVLRSGQEVNLSFKLLVKNSAPVGAMVTGQTRVLVSEYEGIPPVENAIRIGAAGQTMQLAQTGPAGILGLLMALSALAALAHRLLRNASYLRNKRLALQSL